MQSIWAMEELSNSALDKDSRGRLWWREEWYSICSAHRQTDDSCSACSHGVWVNVVDAAITKFFYRHSPRLWTWWWANR